jgi:D-glycero-D-manno-heptose 1,7-bisphosphate phosphatase
MRPVARPAVFLDRDGVIIENRSDYVKSRLEVSFLPGAREALQRLSRSEHAIVMVTNQSAVGRGMISLEEAMEINRHVIAAIEAQGGRVDAWYVCPHHPDERCDCRKPAPGMLLRAAEELGLDLARSYLVGDAVSDIQAGWAVGVQGILVLTGRGSEQVTLLRRENEKHCPVVADLNGALDYILSPNHDRASLDLAADPSRGGYEP